MYPTIPIGAAQGSRGVRHIVRAESGRVTSGVEYASVATLSVVAE